PPGGNDVELAMNKGARIVAWALLTPPPAWRVWPFAPARPPFYDEDGINLDSLPAPGRGGRPACRAWAVAPATRGCGTGIVDRRLSSPTARSGSRVSTPTQQNLNRPHSQGRIERMKRWISLLTIAVFVIALAMPMAAGAGGCSPSISGAN